MNTSNISKQLTKQMIRKMIWSVLVSAPILIGLLVLFVGAMIFLAVQQQQVPSQTSTSQVSSSSLSPDVLKWEPTVQETAKALGIEEYVPLILALIMQESGGQSLDVMQASEGQFNTKYPKIPNGITDPFYSIWCGVQEFKVAIKQSGVTGPNDIDHIKLALQGYNFGPGFIDYVKQNGGNYTLDLAKSFSAMEAQKLGWTCSTWQTQPYCFGDINYPDHVLHYDQTGLAVGGVVDRTGTGIANKEFSAILTLATQFEGMPYVFGGKSPATSFDCSGLIEYVYGQIGIHVSGSAEAQYNQTIPVTNPSPGDLVFFQDTYKPGISHVGIYTGENQMFDAQDSGIHYADLNLPYWKEHFAGFRRVP